MSLFQCITCPAEDNATFAVCPWSTQFVGCCKQIITCDESCSSDDLRPTSFLPECFSQIHNQICPPDSQWYTCNDTNPTFMGCCKQNACANGGCSSAYLAAATLSSNPEDAHDYIPLDVTSDTSVKKYHTAVIAASSVGGVVLLSIVLAFLVLYRHRKAKRSRKAHKEFVRASAKVVEKTDSVAAPAEPIAQAPNQARYESILFLHASHPSHLMTIK